MPIVKNKHRDRLEAGDVYVGRPTKWGNPFTIGKLTREQVVDAYAATILGAPKEIRNEIRRELRGKNLVCWCSPAQCHADILLEIANSEVE